MNPVVNHENPLYRRAALAALAVTSEGCADHYRNQLIKIKLNFLKKFKSFNGFSYLEFLVNLCIKGVFDSDIEVVSTSFFALCQFTEYLTVSFNLIINQFVLKSFKIFFNIAKYYATCSANNEHFYSIY